MTKHECSTFSKIAYHPSQVVGSRITLNLCRIIWVEMDPYDATALFLYSECSTTLNFHVCGKLDDSSSTGLMSMWSSRSVAGWTSHTHWPAWYFFPRFIGQVVLVVKKKKNSPAKTGEVRLVFDPWVRKIPWRRAWQPTPVCLPGEPHGQRGIWWATVHGVAKSWTQLSNQHTNVYIFLSPPASQPARRQPSFKLFFSKYMKAWFSRGL